MSSKRQLVLSLLALVACLFVACQSQPPVRYANFPDAVTNINQVDPEYRKYFEPQQGLNFSAADQRKALAAAIQTARTPVPAYVPRSAMASSRKSARRGSARSGSRKAVARKRVKATRKSAVAKRRATTRRRRS